MDVWNDYVYNKLAAFDLNSRSILCFPTLGMAFYKGLDVGFDSF
jgi:hypothetical protein